MTGIFVVFLLLSFTVFVADGQQFSGPMYASKNITFSTQPILQDPNYQQSQPQYTQQYTQPYGQSTYTQSGYGQQVYGQSQLYVDTPATTYNTYRAANCISTGTYCSNQENCCTKTCKLAPGKSGRVCCLPEGNVCDTSKRGNPGLRTCCAGTKCLPLMEDSDGFGDPRVSVCQTPTTGSSN